MIQSPIRSLATIVCAAAVASLAGATVPASPAPAAPPAGAARTAGPEPSFDWVVGPATAQLGKIAKIEVPAGYRFTGVEGTRKIMELTHNPVSGSELGTLIPEAVPSTGHAWFLVFEFEPIGYVKDDEKSKLDADKILASLRKGTESQNEERKKRGWDPVAIDGWKVAPFYNEATHNLEWAVLVSSSKGRSVNYSTRLLGRRGVMSVDLVLDPEQLDAVRPTYQGLLTHFDFTDGERYAEFRKGDKVAEYGLVALVAGGAAAVAFKTGLLAKFWKLIVIGIAALGGAVKKIWVKISRRNEETIPGPDTPTT